MTPTRSESRGESRGGFVLITSVVLLLAFTLVVTALWSLARLEAGIAQAHRTGVEAAYAARALLVRTTRAASTEDSVVSVPGVRVVPHAPALVELRAATSGDDLVALLVTPTGVGIAAEAGAVLVVRTPMTAATRSRIGPPEPGGCGLPPLAATAPWPGRDPTLAGLGPQDASALLPELVPVLDLDADSGGVAQGGGAGSILVRGAGSAVMVADRIVLDAGAVVRGFLRTQGDLIVGDGAVLEGGAVVGGRLQVAPGGAVRPSGCVAAAALDASGLVRPRAVGPVGWPRR